MNESQPGALVDDEARRRIETDLDSTLLVEAGAGTGKTRALVARVVELVVSGRARLGQLAAITFTEAAAAELRARVGARLAELAIERPHDERIVSALGELDDAVLTTIHGFAQRLLAEYPLAADLPPRIKVLDDFEADLEFSRRFARFLDELFDDKDGAQVLAAALALRISPRHVEQLARQVDEAWDVHAERASSGREDPRTVLAGIAAAVEREAALVASALELASAVMVHCTDPGDTLAVSIGSLAPHLAAYDPGDEWLGVLRWLTALPPARVGNKGVKALWSVPVAEAREVVGQYELARSASLVAVSEQVLRALLHRLGRAAGLAAQERRAGGTLRFHDLLVLARDLLATDLGVRSAVSRRFVQILVDEFQDTDALQLEIVRLAAGEADDGARGKLFFVGDPKQAIYRFRGADVALYERVRREIVGDDAISLVTNFRSVPGVLAWVNRTFEPLLGASSPTDRDREGPTSPRAGDAPRPSAWTGLAPARAATSGQIAVTVLGGPIEDVGARVRRRSESEEIAAAIAAAVRDGWPVADDGGIRPARFGDVALLVPRRTGLDELEAALDDWEIPYRVQSSILVYASTEVRDLLACLRAVDSPGDESALVAALRTPELACADDDLAEFRRSGGQWRIDVVPPPALEDHRVARGLRAIASMHHARHTLGVVGTLEAIVERWRVLQLASGLRRREEAWRRIMVVIDQARDFVDAGGRSIAELLAWTDRQATRMSRGADPVVDGEDAVRILTVHGAKGLEFPIVALADLGARPPGRRGADVLFDPDGRVEARVAGGIETSGYANLASADDELELAEQLRLCYVAATRARDHLVISLRHRPSGRSPSLAELLWEACQAWPETWRPGSTVPGLVLVPPILDHLRPVQPGRADAEPSPTVGSGSVGAVSVGATSESYASWLERRARLLSGFERPASVAAGSLAVAAHAELDRGRFLTERRRSTRSRGVERPADDEARADGTGAELGVSSAIGYLGDWQGRRAATELGRAVHGVLQRVDLASGDGLDTLAGLEAARHGCVERTSEVRALARSALATEVVRAAARSGSLHREVPVSAPVAGGLVEGIVDLCFDDDGELVVVDYKTDALEDAGEVASAAHRYRPQVGAYVLALESVLGRPVGRCVLVFLAPPDGAVEHEVSDLAGAVAEARFEIERRLAGAPVQ